MHSHCARPIVMPLSNPTSRVEARPEDIINWTDGAALVATGSPFPPVSYKENCILLLNVITLTSSRYRLGCIGIWCEPCHGWHVNGCQPGISRELTTRTSWRRALLPNIDDIQAVSKAIAMRVGQAAQLQGVAIVTSEEALSKAIEHNYWQPQYRSYKRTSF